MKKMIANKVLEENKPNLVLFIGHAGKTMARMTYERLLSKQEIPYLSADSSVKLVNLLASGSNKPSLAGKLKQLVGKKEKFNHVLYEVGGAVSPATLSLISNFEDVIIVLQSLHQREIAEVGSIQDYLTSLLPIELLQRSQFIVNHDIPGIKDALDALNCNQRLSVSTSDANADIHAQNYIYVQADKTVRLDERIQGISYKVEVKGSTVPFMIRDAIGEQYIYSTLSAVAYGQILQINIIDTLGALREMNVLPGRMKIVPGIKKTTIIDDTYTIDIESAFTALEQVSQLPLAETSKRAVIIGDVPELGAETESLHCFLGSNIANFNYDLVIGVGEKARDIIRCVVDANAGIEVHHFMDKNEAGRFMQDLLKSGDILLVKGSAEDKLETVVKELMAFPLQAKKELLQR